MEIKGITLPSRGLVYNVPLSGISVKTFRGRDEKLLSEMSTQNFEKKFAAVMRGLITGIDPDQLTLGDRGYLMCWQAINSYTPRFPIHFHCGACETSLSVVADLSKLPIVELPDGFKEPYMLEMVDGTKLGVKLLRVADEISAADVEANAGPNWLYRFALSIVDERTLPDRLTWMEDMPAKDLARIRAFHEKFVHGPRMETEYKCTKCEYRGQVKVPMSLALFFPTDEALG